MDCSDPRDKVYALLGMLPPEQRIVVDYTKSIEQVFLDVIKKSPNNSLRRAEKAPSKIWLRTSAWVRLAAEMGLTSGGQSELANLNWLIC